MSKSNKVKIRFVHFSVAIILCASALGQSQPGPLPSPSSLSPDKKWQYTGGDVPKIFQVDSNQVALDLSEGCQPGDSAENPVVLWAPDSRRLAFYCGQGKQRLTLLYQLRDEGWVALETPGDGDELFERVGKIIEGQAKRKGPTKKTFLHMQWWAVDPQRWLDARTLSMHVSMAEVLRRDNGGFVGRSFRTDLLVTLEFNDAGDWKIVKTHQMSEKERKKFDY